MLTTTRILYGDHFLTIGKGDDALTRGSNSRSTGHHNTSATLKCVGFVHTLEVITTLIGGLRID